MNEKFTHNGSEFEIRNFNDGTKIRVKVFLCDQQISPEYSADLEVAYDYFNAHGEAILKTLKKIARADIENGLYYKR